MHTKNQQCKSANLLNSHLSYKTSQAESLETHFIIVLNVSSNFKTQENNAHQDGLVSWEKHLQQYHV